MNKKYIHDYGSVFHFISVFIDELPSSVTSQINKQNNMRIKIKGVHFKYCKLSCNIQKFLMDVSDTCYSRV